MTKLSVLIWMAIIVVAAFMLYSGKYQVQALRAQIAVTSRQIEQEKEALHVVAAEWAYLNRPERLQTLAEKYLSASGVTVDQVAEIEAIPFPQQQLAANEEEFDDSDEGLLAASLIVPGRASGHGSRGGR